MSARFPAGDVGTKATASSRRWQGRSGRDGCVSRRGDITTLAKRWGAAAAQSLGVPSPSPGARRLSTSQQPEGDCRAQRGLGDPRERLAGRLTLLQ